MSNLTVVVAGFPAMADALRGSGRFADVVSVASTSQLRDALTSGLLSGGVDGKLFLFADSTTVDTKVTLEQLLQKLVGMGAPAVILATSPGARDLLAAAPAAGLLEGPFLLNNVLGALSGLRTVPALEPVEPARNVTISLPGHGEPAPLFEAAPAAGPAAPASTSPFAAAPTTAPPAPPAPRAPFAAEVPSAPAAPSTPAAPAPEQVSPAFPAARRPFTPAPVTAEPSTGPGAPFQPAGTPASPFQAGPPAPPAPQAAPETAFQAGPFEATPAPASATPPASTPAPASPFQSAPFQSAPVQPAPFGTQAPFGAPALEQPEVANDPFTKPPLSTGTPFSAAPSAAPAASPFGGAPSSATPFGAAPWEAAAPVARAGAAAPERPERRGIVITVTAPKGGTGKSTLSLNLAAYLGLRLRGTGRNVCIVDSNVQQADTGKYLHAYTPNIEGVLKDVSAIHPDRITNYLLHKPELNLSALLGPASPENANPLYFTGKRYAQIVQALKPNYDYIILDTPVAELYHEIFRDCALPLADFIVTTITPNITTLMNTDGWLRQVTAPIAAGGMGVDRAKVGVVLNRAQEDVGMDEGDVRRELGEWRFLGSIPETKEWQRCNNEGELVATKNYHELNEAFAVVLSAATGEELLSTTPAALQTGKGGLGAMLGRLLGRKG